MTRIFILPMHMPHLFCARCTKCRDRFRGTCALAVHVIWFCAANTLGADTTGPLWKSAHCPHSSGATTLYMIHAEVTLTKKMTERHDRTSRRYEPGHSRVSITRDTNPRLVYWDNVAFIGRAVRKVGFRRGSPMEQAELQHFSNTQTRRVGAVASQPKQDWNADKGVLADNVDELGILLQPAMYSLLPSVRTRKKECLPRG